MESINNNSSFQDLNQSFSDGVEMFMTNKNLRIYFKWCQINKRTWSDSFSDWCRLQDDLTPQLISQQWKYNAVLYRNRDIQDAVKRENQNAINRRYKRENPGSYQNDVKAGLNYPNMQELPH